MRLVFVCLGWKGFAVVDIFEGISDFWSVGVGFFRISVVAVCWYLIVVYFRLIDLIFGWGWFLEGGWCVLVGVGWILVCLGGILIYWIWSVFIIASDKLVTGGGILNIDGRGVGSILVWSWSEVRFGFYLLIGSIFHWKSGIFRRLPFIFWYIFELFNFGRSSFIYICFGPIAVPVGCIGGILFVADGVTLCGVGKAVVIWSEFWLFFDTWLTWRFHPSFCLYFFFFSFRSEIIFAYLRF